MLRRRHRLCDKHELRRCGKEARKLLSVPERARNQEDRLFHEGEGGEQEARAQAERGSPILD